MEDFYDQQVTAIDDVSALSWSSDLLNPNMSDLVPASNPFEFEHQPSAPEPRLVIELPPVPETQQQQDIVQADQAPPSVSKTAEYISSLRSMLRKVICNDAATMFFQSRDPAAMAPCMRAGRAIQPNAADAWKLIKGCKYVKGEEDYHIAGAERRRALTAISNAFTPNAPIEMDIIDPPITELIENGVTNSCYASFLNMIRQTYNFTTPYVVDINVVKTHYVSRGRKSGIPHVIITELLQQPRPSVECLGDYGQVLLPIPAVTLPTTASDGRGETEIPPSSLKRALEEPSIPTADEVVAAPSPAKRARCCSEDEAALQLLSEKEIRLSETESKEVIIAEKIKMMQAELDKAIARLEEVRGEKKEVLAELELARKRVDGLMHPCCICETKTCKMGVVLLSMQCGHVCCPNCFNTKVKEMFASIKPDSMAPCPGCIAKAISSFEVDSSLAEVLPPTTRGCIDPHLCRLVKDRLELDQDLVHDLAVHQSSFFEFISVPAPAGVPVRKSVCPNCGTTNFGMSNYERKVARCSNPACLSLYCTKCLQKGSYHFDRGC